MSYAVMFRDTRDYHWVLLRVFGYGEDGQSDAKAYAKNMAFLHSDWDVYVATIWDDPIRWKTE